MDELDELEEAYFGKKKVSDKMEEAKLKGLYEYCWMLEPPEEPDAHVQYNLLLNLAQVAPRGSEAEFIREKLEAYGSLRNGDRGLEKRIAFAVNWIEDFSEPEIQKVTLSSLEEDAIRELIIALNASSDGESYQSAVFEVAKDRGIRPRDLFQLLYRILLGQSKGPRFGPFVTTMGRDKVTEELSRAIQN
jgi:lysyl-tRNA synthetase class 1